MSTSLPLAGKALPLGFPNCEHCPFRVNGPVRVCLQCARATTTPLPEPHCPVCSQALGANGKCTNLGVCEQPSRSINAIDAIAVYEGNLALKIKALKYYGKTGWAIIFGRLVAAHLYESSLFDNSELVLPNPTLRRPGGVQHTELIVDYAAQEDLRGCLTYQTLLDPLIIKTKETRKSAAQRLMEKQAAADELVGALELPHGDETVRGRSIVIVDDICTTGSQLDAVARFLLLHGASEVNGLVLARTPWK